MTNTFHSSEKFWDKAAKGYDRAEAGDSEKQQLACKIIGKYLKPTTEVLDIGCGTALLTCQIASQVKRVHGIDISSKMLEQAELRAEQMSLNNIAFTHTNVFDTTCLAPKSYDLVMANYLLHLLNNPEKDLKRIHQLLKPDGLFISVTPCMKEKPLLAGSLKILAKMGLAPSLKAFSLEKLEALINGQNWEIIEKTKLSKSDPEYLIVAKKS